MLHLKQFQREKIDELISSVSKLLQKKNDEKKVCVFQSPTGSGKTTMVAVFIQELIKELPERDMCFLWVSIGKGELHKQSKKALEKIFNGFPQCVLVEEEFFGSKKYIEQNEVVVVNWEKLRTKDNATGEWKNALMKDGERTNFREVVKATREKRAIILIIDESHFASTTERTQELRDIINANVTIEMSATPTLQPSSIELAKGNAFYIYVEAKDVIASGLIKQELFINAGIDSLSKNEKDSQETILEAAHQKRLELKALFEKENVKINPLVLVQLPNSEAGDVKREAVEKFLQEKSITENNGKLAVWLSDEQSEHLQFISNPDNEIEFLIFKQAIDTGWDCPRAHILVKFRDIKSEIFEIQTVGRILRMPEQKHYASEQLNTGFIFTNVHSIEVKKEEYNPNIIKHLKSGRKDIYKELNLLSYYRMRVDFGDITSSFYKVLEQVFCKELEIGVAQFQTNINKLKKQDYDMGVKSFEDSIIENASVEVRRFDELKGKLVFDNSSSQYLRLSDDDLYNYFNEVINKCLGEFAPKRSTPTVREAIYQWFEKYVGIKRYNNGAIIIQNIFVNPNNVGKFSQLLSKAIEEYKPVKEEERKKKMHAFEDFYRWEIEKEEFFNQHTDEKAKTKLNIYEPCYLAKERSIPEKNFEEFIDAQKEKIVWWYKNGKEKRTYFSVRYEEDGYPKSFYPDYVVQFKDGRVGIFDTKEGQTAKDAKAKAEALQKYIREENIKGKNLFGGILIQDDNEKWRLNQNAEYEYNPRDLRDWHWMEEMM